MRRILSLLIVVAVISGVMLCGCAQKEASSSAAIQKSEAMAAVQDKVNYLIGQAKAFYNSKDFKEAINVAQYVLSRLDQNSQEAKNLLEKARGQLEAAAKKAASEVTGAFKGLGQ